MARYEVSEKGAEALMQLSKSLLSAYSDVISAGESLERKVSPFAEYDSKLYTDIADASQSVTAYVKAEKDNILLLAGNLKILSFKITELISSFSTPAGGGNCIGVKPVTAAGDSLSSTNASNEAYRKNIGEDEYKKYQNIYDAVNSIGVSDTYKNTLVEELKHMDPELKGLYNDYANDLKCLDTNYSGTAQFDPSKGGFLFSETEDIKKGLGVGNTFFHESAHMIDWLAGKNGIDLSAANDLTSAAQEDYKDALSNIMKTHNCSLEAAQSKLNDELWAHPVESNCVSDVFGGLSRNIVNGAWGHRTAYWDVRPRSTIGAEAFAEITADSASNPQSLAFTKKYMPKTYSAYQNIIKGARKNG